MRKSLPIILLSLIPLSGCSSPEPKLSYDPVELIEYERCLNTVPSQYQYDERIWAVEGIAENYCESKKPVLK